jgi:hypothetical protein
MALFTDKRELDRQESVANLNPSGNETALSLLGYDKYGQMNNWGKINPLVGGGVTNKIASKVATGDTKQVFEDSQAEANQHTLSKLKLAADVMTLGTGSAATKAISKGIGMVQGGEDTDIGGMIKGISGKNDAMDSLNSGAEKSTEVGPGGVDSFGDAVLTDNPEEDGLSSAGMEKFTEFMKENPNGTREMFEETMKEAGGMEGLLQEGSKLAAGLDKVEKFAPVIGSAVGAVSSGMAYNEALKDNAVTDGKKTMNTFNYL